MEFLKANARRMVVKIGTHSLTGPDGLVDESRLADLCRQVALVRASGVEVILVSSGAVGMGLGLLGKRRRPEALADLQACAAIGQSRLVEVWRSGLEAHGLTAAQILLTREDIRGRRRHLAVRSTLERLLALGTVPIVNENDTVSADEIKFGDNDILSALVASLLKADLLVILSTIPGLLRDQGQGELVPVVTEITEDLRRMAGGTGDPNATGGMVTKLEAAHLATRSGCGVFIGSSRAEGILPSVCRGSAKGTFFVPAKASLAARKRWIAFFERPQGCLRLDDGAVAAVRDRSASLLAKGIVAVEGEFPAQAVVRLANAGGREFARGICGFPAREIHRLCGLDSTAIRREFPGRRPEIVHRDSLVLL